jgi:hypothetical protein
MTDRAYLRGLGLLLAWIAFRNLATLADWPPGFAPTFIHYPGVPDLLGLRAWLSSSSAAALNFNFAVFVLQLLGALAVAAGGQGPRVRVAWAAATLPTLHFLLLDAVFYREGPVAVLAAAALSGLAGRVYARALLVGALAFKWGGAGAVGHLSAAFLGADPVFYAWAFWTAAGYFIPAGFKRTSAVTQFIDLAR